MEFLCELYEAQTACGRLTRPNELLDHTSADTAWCAVGGLLNGARRFVEVGGRAQARSVTSKLLVFDTSLIVF